MIVNLTALTMEEKAESSEPCSRDNSNCATDPFAGTFESPRVA